MYVTEALDEAARFKEDLYNSETGTLNFSFVCISYYLPINRRDNRRSKPQAKFMTTRSVLLC